jgi:CSLREA domain-containing protein
LLLLAALAPSATPGRAETSMIVSTTADELNDNGECSLREAVRLANGTSTDPACGDDQGAPYSIVLADGETYTLSIAGSDEDDAATGDLDVRAQVTIGPAGDGAATVDGGGLDRVFQVHAGGDFTLRGITVTGGAAAAVTLDEGGGGIHNAGTLTLDRSSVTGNTVAGGAFETDGAGGGIYNAGSLTLIDSEVTQNRVADGFVEGPGGGIYSADGSLTLMDSVVSNNAASFGSSGGGIVVAGGGATLNRSFVTGNGAWGAGGIDNSGEMALVNSQVDRNSGGIGGVWNQGYMTISGTTIIGNESDHSSGTGGITNTGELHVFNSTISGNLAGAPYAPGGIAAGGTTTLTNVTISGNRANVQGGTGGISSGPGTVVSNSIIAGNAGVFIEDGIGDDCAGSFITGGQNLIGDPIGCSVGAGDILGADPLLGELADNGGPTLTHALLHGSPAIDAGDDTVCSADPVNNLDQRGFYRPQDGDGDGAPVCDIGAFELECVGEECAQPLDTDDDGVSDALDNCPLAPNPLQENLDDDGTGDACDADGLVPLECEGIMFDAVFIGAPGNGKLTGTPYNDLILAGDGNDHVEGAAGDDCIDAGAGTDHVAAGEGDDVVLGGPGNNHIGAGEGANTVITSEGNDRVITGSGPDRIDSAGGNDWISAGAGDDVVAAGAGNDWIGCGDGFDVAESGTGLDWNLGGRCEVFS